MKQLANIKLNLQYYLAVFTSDSLKRNIIQDTSVSSLKLLLLPYLSSINLLQLLSAIWI